MEDITRLVDTLLARHGLITSSKESHLVWSGWFGCLSTASMLLASGRPGVLALAEETNSPRASLPPTGASPDRERMLALFQVTDTEDLGIELARLFWPGNPARRKLASGRCFARYVVIEDSNKRSALCRHLRHALKSQVLFVMEREHFGFRAEVASDFAHPVVGPEASPSVGLRKDVENRELRETVRRPASLPSGF